LKFITESAFEVARNLFFEELERKISSQENEQKEKSQHSIAETLIPLPASNSLAAKQIRFAAGLAVLESTLQR
jgi:hypothetical protein